MFSSYALLSSPHTQTLSLTSLSDHSLTLSRHTSQISPPFLAHGLLRRHGQRTQMDASKPLFLFQLMPWFQIIYTVGRNVRICPRQPLVPFAFPYCRPYYTLHWSVMIFISLTNFLKIEPKECISAKVGTSIKYFQAPPSTLGVWSAIAAVSVILICNSVATF